MKTCNGGFELNDGASSSWNVKSEMEGGPMMVWVSWCKEVVSSWLEAIQQGEIPASKEVQTGFALLCFALVATLLLHVDVDVELMALLGYLGCRGRSKIPARPGRYFSMGVPSNVHGSWFSEGVICGYFRRGRKVVSSCMVCRAWFVFDFEDGRYRCNVR